MNHSSPARQIGRVLWAVVFAAAGIVVGWLVVRGVLALPLPEAALFGLSSVAAIAFLVGAVFWHLLWGRALLGGGFVGVVLSIVLVLLFVTT
jgi:hypothetical protein